MIKHKWMPWVGTGLLIFTLFCWILTWQLDGWILHSLERYLTRKTQFNVHIEKLRTDLKQGILDIHNLSISNPNTFAHPHFLEINQIKIHVDWLSLFTSRIIINELVLDINELCGVRNQNGDINILIFSDALEKSSSSEKEVMAPAQDRIHKTAPEFLIRRLLFRLNQATVADYKDASQDVKSARLSICRVFNNVSNYQQVLVPIATDLSVFVSKFILDAVFKSTIGPERYKEFLPKNLDPVKNNIEQTIEKVKKDTQQLFQKLLPEAKADPKHCIESKLSN